MKDAKHNTGSDPLAPLHRLEFILQHKADQLLRAQLGVGFGQMRIMEELSPTKACSQRQLASKLYQTESNISRQLRLLEAKELVNIARNPGDKRQRQVTLTNKGTQTYTKAQKILADLHKQTIAKLDYRDVFNFGETAAKLLKSL